ncbi:hypothetical protein HYY74_01755 [Candidatus Woesearchaeota archaeon]|nr:hypothetical protein [Candidatus Woesearchaeota archaeon]
MENELDQIRQRKLEMLQRQYQDQAAAQIEEEQQARQQIGALEAFVKPKMAREALTRYGNIKAAHPDKAVQLLVVLARLIQAGRMDSVSDLQMKELLKKLSEPKSQGRIVRR